MRTTCWLGSLNARELSKDLFIYGNNIKMDLKETGLEVVDFIRLAQDTDRWRGLINRIMNLRVL
jgi:hypothetical protein